jgi:FMN phosphatase YigB (HAD superfamily)
LAAHCEAEGASTDSLPVVACSTIAPVTCTGLLFDTGDVLFDQTAWWRWVVRLLWRLGKPVHYADLYRIWKQRFRSDVNCGRREYWDAFRALIRWVGLTAGQADELVLASQFKRRQFHDSIIPLPGVLSTLAQLAARGTPLGVLCNASDSCACVAGGLHRLGMDAYFQTVLSTVELGVCLVDRQAYDAAAERMGLEVSQIAFVGHDAEELAGAAGAGLRTIAFNNDCDARADVYLDRFDQLVQAVHVASSRRQAG